MPTKRTIAQLINFFAPGQDERSITPDRVQDLVQTMTGGYGRVYGNSSTTFTLTQNVWQVVNVETELSNTSRQFTMPSNGRLQCTCPVSSLMIVSGFLTLETDGPSEFEVAVFRNGVLEPASVNSVRLPPGGGSATVPVADDFTQEQNDFIETYIRRISGDRNPSVTHYFLSAITSVVT
jgi:hypothetical protein